MEEMLKKLKALLAEGHDLQNTANLLNWDMMTQMPAGGAPARTRQYAIINRLCHEKLTDPAIGSLLDKLRPYEESLPYDSDDASFIRVARRKYERNTKIPSDFLGEFYKHTSVIYQVWTQARPANDFARVRPYLEKTLELSRKMANFFPGYEHIADPLIDRDDYGVKVSTLRPLFANLRHELVALVKKISAQAETDDACLSVNFPPAQQEIFGREVARMIGYDFQRGRLDSTHHPFTTRFSIGDVRITTRYNPNDLGDALFSTIHEAGHAMYEQGINKDFEASPLAEGTSAGVHESQSRLWENVVGRSRGFWTYFYPRLQQVFLQQLGNVPLQTFYHAINKVKPSLIRTDADEVTYNLHVMVRFELELALLEGRLEVGDLPQAWSQLYHDYLGVTPPDDRNGCMQDVHWFSLTIGGMFQGYTLGNILGILFYNEALKAHPEITNEIEQGQFNTLFTWLRENIYQHGSKFTTDELLQRITGGPIRLEPYLTYLKTKYSELYSL